MVRIISLAVFAFACAIPLTIQNGSAADVSMDGGWWASLGSDQRFTATEALIAAFESGYFNGFVAAALDDVGHYHSTRPYQQVTAAVNSHVGFSQALGTYEQRITDFYSAYPGSEDVRVGDVLLCLADTPIYSCATVATFHPSQ